MHAVVLVDPPRSHVELRAAELIDQHLHSLFGDCAWSATVRPAVHRLTSLPRESTYRITRARSCCLSLP